MLRQALTTPSRALRSSLRTQAKSALLRTEFQAVPAFSIKPARAPVTRWYSAEAESKESSDATKKTEESKPENGQSEAEAALKNQLEAKEKEALDFKVRNSIIPPSQYSSSCNLTTFVP
jgi:molecular chaperone GrpE